MATHTVSSWFTKMFGQPMTLGNLEDLLLQQLQDLYSAEIQLVDALPKMAAAAAAPQLRSAFEAHLTETVQHRKRLEQILRSLGHDAKDEGCEAMEGLIQEGEAIIGLDGDALVKDAALIAAAQRVEHYEIAGYGCARSFARHLGRHGVAEGLQRTLDDEAKADKLLTGIAEELVNPQAARS